MPAFRSAPLAAVLAEEALRVPQRIERVGEKAGMAARTPKHKAIFILNLALNGAVAKGGVDFRGRDGSATGGRGAETCCGHA